MCCRSMRYGLRTVFALGELVDRLDPDGGAGLIAALMPLIPRLPEIINNAEAAVTDAGTI